MGKFDSSEKDFPVLTKEAFICQCHRVQTMGAGGSAEAMKFSDVLILVGIGMLCAGFIIHGWVENTQLDSEGVSEYEKSVFLLKGDKLMLDIESISDSEGDIAIFFDNELIDEERFTLTAGQKESMPSLESKEYGEYRVEIIVDSGSIELDVDISRTMMLDFLIYPIGAAILIFGLQKRGVELANQSIDAELELDK